MTVAGRIEEAVQAMMAAVDRTVAANDTMYTGDDQHYFSVGASALKAMLLALESAGKGAPRRVLDFGCGYGRVMRAMRGAFPDAELLACDVDAAGVDHCARAFGARAMGSSADLGRLEHVREVDLLWCGSVLTHLDAPQWPRLLGHFADALADGGVAVVTTHGRVAGWRLESVTDYGLEPRARATVLAAYGANGFGYHDYPGQKGYGISVSSPAWVLRQVEQVPALRAVAFAEGGWDRHQDVLSLAKDADRLLKRND